MQSRSNMNLNLEQEIYSMKDRIASLNNQEIKYAQMNAEGLIDTNQLRGLIKQTKDKKLGFFKRLKELENTKPKKSSITSEEVEEVYRRAQETLKQQDFSDKKLVLRDLVSKILIKKGGVAETWLNISLNTLYLEHGTERWYCRSSQCRKKHFV